MSDIIKLVEMIELNAEIIGAGDDEESSTYQRAIQRREYLWTKLRTALSPERAAPNAAQEGA